MSVEYLNERSDMPIAHGIPGHCNLQDTVDRIRSYVPVALKINGGTPSIQSVDLLADEARIMYSASPTGKSVLHMLQCPARLTWSDGHEQLGFYTEWEDHQDQVHFDFTPRGFHPH